MIWRIAKFAMLSVIGKGFEALDQVFNIYYTSQILHIIISLAIY